MGQSFQVVRVKHRGPVKAKPAKPVKDAPLPLTDVIARLSRLKDMIINIRGVGRFGPEAFAEDKSEARQVASRLEDDLRRRGVAP